MLATSLLAIVALLAGSNASPTPFQKRFTGATILSGRTNTCLTLPSGTKPSNGALLTVGPCSTATKWDINPGSGSVIVSGTNYALDAGTNPHNNVAAKVWTSYPGLTQQTWYLTNDNRIAITGGNQCLDEGDNGPQTYQCTTGNTNQVWYVNAAPPPVSSSSKAPASSSASASKSVAPSSSKASASSTPTAPPGNKFTIRWKGNTGLCASVQGPFQSGSIVNLEQCDNDIAQQFMYGPDGGLQLADTSAGAFCLDAGSNPASGTQMKIWQCYPGAPQQTWTYPGALVKTANNQCLDINNQGNTQIQTYTCSQPDPQQQFTFTSV